MTVSLESRIAALRVRWEREIDELSSAHPPLMRVVRSIWHRPAVVTTVLAVLTSAGFAAVVPGGDAALFRTAGLGMMGSRFLDVFDNGTLQIGPVYLTLLGALTWILDLASSPAFTRIALAAAQAALLLWCALSLVRRCARRLGTRGLPGEWAVGLVLAVGGFVAEATGNGHPEELLVGILLGHAALWAEGGHGVLAGLVLGLATGVKQWGAFGAGALLLARRRRDVLGGAAAALLLVALLYAPFFLFGAVHTYEFQWGIDDRSVLGRLGASWGLSDWELRLVQGAAAGAAGILAAWRRPRSPLAPIIVAITVRLLLDPLRLSYYSGPLVVLLATWGWTSVHPVVVRWRTPLTLLTPLVVLLPYLLPRDVAWGGGSVLLAASVIAVLLIDTPHERSFAHDHQSPAV